MTSVILFNNGASDGFVGIAAPSLTRIIPIDLAVNFYGRGACNVVVGAEGILGQKLSGQGLAFIVAGGSEKS
ncbi:hypothetical protein H6P81_019979 [Aristolochia fimbriata]|uniref:Uncharacterized protein n=1 Tax=Aristolochia fimbriata TaxID=158543 RepID=A0AAV7DU52_ARIFI|nr:hypothetical protein H6P81_019979 [Aristolochia fimbriata]